MFLKKILQLSRLIMVNTMYQLRRKKHFATGTAKCLTTETTEEKKHY